jgi:hypothetical protein
MSRVSSYQTQKTSSYKADKASDDEENFLMQELPVQVLHRMLQGPSAFIAPPDETAREVIQTPLLAAQSGMGSMQTEENTRALQQQSPLMTATEAVRPLAQLHPDIIPGFKVDSKYIVIPDTVRKKFIGQSTHIPLNLLTNTACADSGADTSSSMMEFLHVDQVTGQLIQVDSHVA